MAFLILANGGCDSGPKMHDVEGTLTHDGTPIPEITVIFHPVDQNANPQASAITDENGRFVMQVGRTMGVRPGEYIVYVQDPAALQGGQTSTEEAYLGVLEKYPSQEVSTHKIQVDADMKNLDLKLD